MAVSLHENDWFQRIKMFNSRPCNCDETEHIDVNSCISSEFYDILTKNQIDIDVITYPLSLYDTANMYIWCSDNDSYKYNRTKPVLYIDAHYDVVWKNMITPLLLGDIAIASCHDNRASCNVLCKAIQNGIFTERNDDFITYVIFSDGEERGMLGISHWFTQTRVIHDEEKYIVMDVSNDICETYRQSNVGYGVYSFNGDPIEQYILPTDPIMQQIATHKDIYPDNLCYTHGSILYHKYKCDVSRMGLPVAGIANTFSGDEEYTTSLHISHTAISINDLDNYYKKLSLIIKRIKIPFIMK